MLGSLRRELGDLDRITAWLRVLGMVNVSPGATQLAGVINGFSTLILDVFGPDVGGLLTIRRRDGGAFGVAVEIEAEIEIR